MSPLLRCEPFIECSNMWKARSYVTLPLLNKLARKIIFGDDFSSDLLTLFKAFNGSDTSLTAISSAENARDFAAKALQQYVADNSLNNVPYETISASLFTVLRNKLFMSPETFMSEDLPGSYYPYYSPGRTYGYKPHWVKETTGQSKTLFKTFSESRRSDTAILVGNGPSLNKVDFKLFQGQDVYVSNYAIKNETIAQYARGVAVTNHLVAEQEPYWFQLISIWKFHPLWLAYTLPPTDTSITLNALGGTLFFSENIVSKIAWHSTVTYFWLQILYSAGYKKIILTGFDHFYHQKHTAKEGDLIKQTTDDRNHFDPNYFRGKTWQAADVSKMEETYVLAKAYYEKDGREIVNATVGGHLEVFRRSELYKEISRPRLYGRIVKPDSKPKVAIATAFWKGDIDQAELHWCLINRLGVPSADHIYLFKHGFESLRPNTLPRVICADIENNYPLASQKPHPAGPNLVFVHTVKTLLETKYTHFFWLEPDCIPTLKDWLAPFISRLEEYPNEPIVGTGGGTVSPGKLHWRNHFAGCSLYSLKHLSEVDWDRFVNNELHVSFDVWLAVNLGYIRLEEVNNNDKSDTIIYGKDRYNWSVLRKPKSLVYGMFEHWRPEKILTPTHLEQRLSWNGFSLYHAIKDSNVIKRLYKRLPKSASTIIINYNNEKYLFEAIQSALNQKIENIQYEVIVVDDGSTDSSISIIKSFGNKIKAVFLEHGIISGNFNQQRALKEALKVASGEVLLLLDGDDIFYEVKLQRICSMFDDHEVVLGQHTLNLIDEKGSPLTGSFKAFPNESIKPSLYERLGRVNLFQATSGLAFRRSYLVSQLHLLCVDNHVNTWLDVRLTRFAPYFGKVYSSDDRLGAWRRHANSDSIRTDNIADRVQEHESWYDQVASKHGFPSIPFKWKRCENLTMMNNQSGVMPVLGPFGRDEHAHWDETLGVREYTSSNKSGTMIDVGAHEGYALMPFLNDGWSVFAFEPDDKNRTKLLERLNKHKNKTLVSLDTRCVSNKSQEGVSFYRSEQSTGISGLSAFHESHMEAQRVDVTTLTEFFHNKPLPAIDFLKIDTEGHDLFVLQGFPWDRGKPVIIECEFEDIKTVPLSYNFHDLARFLVGKGYTVYVSEWHPIIRYGIRHDWNRLVRYPCELADPKGWGNLLAFRDPIDEQAIVAAVRKVLKVEDAQRGKCKANVSPAAKRTPEGAPASQAIGASGTTPQVIPGPHFKPISTNQWRYTHSDAAQKLWQAAWQNFSVVAGRIYVGRLTISANQAMTVLIGLARHGSDQYEGTSNRVKLTPGIEQSVRLSKKFSKFHDALRLQVEVVDLVGGGAADLTIETLSITETLASIQRRLDEGDINLRTANHLFREGDYRTAMGVYLLLHQQRPLRMYPDNALMAARRLGLDWVSSADDLLRAVG